MRKFRAVPGKGIVASTVISSISDDNEMFREIIRRKYAHKKLTKAMQQLLDDYGVELYKTYTSPVYIKWDCDRDTEAKYCSNHEFFVREADIDEMNIADRILKKRDRNKANSFRHDYVDYKGVSRHYIGDRRYDDI